MTTMGREPGGPRNTVFKKSILGSVLAGLLWLVGLNPGHSAGGDGFAVLQNPVVRGAWLYQGYCLHCHGPYEDERLGGEFEDEQELDRAIASEGCKIKWSRKVGGKLHNRDIQALGRYIFTYEELGGPPDLPPLPLPPAEEEPVRKLPKKPDPVAKSKPVVTMDPVLKGLLKINPLANGAYLYTQQCYRCHLSYEKTRRGRGFTMETVRRTIANGKTSTQMKAFSRIKGGELSNKGIEAIVTYIATWEKFDEAPALAEMVVRPPEVDASALDPLEMPQFPPVSGEVAKGERLFVRHCCRCHGGTGEGYVGPRLAKNWWIQRPDLYIKAVVKQGVPGTAMPILSQNGGGPLSAKAIEDVVALIGSWQTKGPAVLRPPGPKED